MAKHLDWMRTRAARPEDVDVAQFEGRKLLGALMESVKLGGITQGVRRRVLDDGTVVEARFDGTTPIVTVHSAPTANASREKRPKGEQPWVPEGFVVYPATATQPAGWGCPIVQIDGDGITPYSHQNLAPGLDVARWTPSGPLGQVLLSRAPNAGYPDVPSTALVPPMYFHASYGITGRAPEPVGAGEMAAYRLEVTDFTAQSPEPDPAKTAQIVGFKRDIFEAVNAHRLSVGRDALMLPIRGHYDSAQATAEVMNASGYAGHYSNVYPPTYKAQPDRYTKDGWGSIYTVVADFDSRNNGAGENWIFSAIDPEIIGTDPDGIDIWRVEHPSPDISATTAYDGWMASPIHLAQIENTSFDTTRLGTTFTHIGKRGAYAVQHFIPESAWIHCANRHWRSKHAEIPSVSWFGFQSINLGWETFPAVYDNSNGIGPPPPNPLIPAFPFASMVGGRPTCWLAYTVDEGHEPVPALTQFIIMRGRIVAIAPRNGLVWAAAVQKLDTGTYRLVVLTHHIEDQPVDTRNGMTAFLRAWYVDMPLIGGFAANPQSIIRGVYGEEFEGWPWDEVNSPYSWRGGELIDVGSTIGSDVQRDMLKYASQWVFNSAGTAAICTRDVATYTDLRDFYTPSGATFTQLTVIDPAVLEITLGQSETGAMTTTLNVIGQPPAKVPVPVATTPYFMSEYIIAAGYDTDDERKYCFVNRYYPVEVSYSDLVHYRHFRWSTDFSSRLASPPGTWFTFDWPSGAGSQVLFHCAVAYTDQSQDILEAAHVHVLDVLDEIVLRVGMRQRRNATPYGGGYIPGHNPLFPECWADTDEGAPIVAVTLWKRYSVIHHRWWHHPDNFVISLIALCFRRADPVDGVVNLWIGTRTVPSLNTLVLASYARNKNDWLWSYIVKPQAKSLWMTAEPGPEGSQCVWGDCGPVADQIDFDAAWNGTFVTRGGQAGGSFATHDELMALTGTPDGGRFLYTRAV